MRTNSKIKIKKGDLVVVKVGKDRGKQAKVEKVLQQDRKVLLPAINQYKKHKKSQGKDKPGEILTLSRPLPVANVAIICPKCKQESRVGFRFEGAKKVRVCRKCDADIN